MRPRHEQNSAGPRLIWDSSTSSATAATATEEETDEHAGHHNRGTGGHSSREGRSLVSAEQRENLDAILRQSAFPADSDVDEQRRFLRELTSAQPLPADVTVTKAELG